MSFESVLRTDILPAELTENQQRVRVIAETQYNTILHNSVRLEKTKTPQPSKSIIEVMELVSQAISDYETRTHTNEDAKVGVTYENPDTTRQVEVISMSLARREPGMFAQGSPFQGNVKNRRPLLREEVVDPDHPGYKRAVLGFFYDNILRLTCWARTNKQANERALWLENVMEEYTWFFVYSGVNRLLYDGRRDETVYDEGTKYYGRPIDYFVRTEKIRQVSEKTLEEVVIRLALANASE